MKETLDRSDIQRPPGSFYCSTSACKYIQAVCTYLCYLQIFPGDLLPSTYPNPDNPLEVRGRTELQRRGKYIDIMEAEFGRLCPTLVEIIKQCLLNAPDKRPSTDALLTRLQRMRSEIEGAQGGSPMNLDIMVRVRMAKEMKMKERQIQKLIEKKVATY